MLLGRFAKQTKNPQSLLQLKTLACISNGPSRQITRRFNPQVNRPAHPVHDRHSLITKHPKQISPADSATYKLLSRIPNPPQIKLPSETHVFLPHISPRARPFRRGFFPRPSNNIYRREKPLRVPPPRSAKNAFSSPLTKNHPFPLREIIPRML